MSTNYGTLAVSGTLRILKNQYLSAFVYSHKDASFTIHSESGAWPVLGFYIQMNFYFQKIRFPASFAQQQIAYSVCSAVFARCVLRCHYPLPICASFFARAKIDMTSRGTRHQDFPVTNFLPPTSGSMLI